MMNHSWKFSRHVLFSLLVSCCVFLVLLGAITAEGATYYVATTGNDANPGTLNQPFKTFAQGVRLLQPGDTLYIRGGLYTERIDVQGPNKTGMPGKYITIAGSPGETVIIQYADTTVAGYGPIKARGNRGYFVFENLILDGINFADEVKWQIRDGNHHFILRKIEMKNFPTSNIYIASGNDITIQDCILHDNISDGAVGRRGYGIYFHDGANGLIEGTEIYNQVGGGIQAYPGPISNLVIRNNKIHDNNATPNSAVGGIVVLGSRNMVSNVSVYNNLIYNNGSSPQSGSSTGLRVDGADTIETKVWNNTVYKNKGYGISMNQAQKTVVQNNIVFGNTKGEIVDFGTKTMLSHNLTTDPKFIRPDAFDFRPQARSYAIDGGVDLGAVTTDFRKITRPQGGAYDIGAYEGSSFDYTSLHPPDDLRIK